LWTAWCFYFYGGNEGWLDDVLFRRRAFDSPRVFAVRPCRCFFQAMPGLGNFLLNHFFIANHVPTVYIQARVSTALRER